MSWSRILFVAIMFFMSLQALASEMLYFNNGERPYFENNDYKVWIESILNEKDYVYINITIFPKVKFRTWYSAKKRQRAYIVSRDELRLIVSDGVKDIRCLTDCWISEDKWANIGNIPRFCLESSFTLYDKQENHYSLRFGGHISSNAQTISLLQDGSDSYFTFSKIPVSFTHHDEWEMKYSNETEIKHIIDTSNDPLCGIYEHEGERYACILHNNTYNLVRLENTQDLVWLFGDIKGSFNRTAIVGTFKGIFKDRGKVVYTNCEYTWNGDLLETKGNGWALSFAKIYPTTSMNNQSSRNDEKWSGSGFALLDGYVVTNNHVADEAEKIEIFGINGDFTKGYEAKIVAKDKVCDIALLRIKETNCDNYWKSIPYTINKSMSEVGEPVYALGYPLTNTMGEEVKLTTGIISARSGFKGDVTNYQITVPIQPGNSGGPMFDENGNIIGVICAKHEGAENVGYAIKTLYLLNLLESTDNILVVPSVTKLKNLTLKDQITTVP